MWLGWGWQAAPHILSAYQSWGPVHSILLWSISQPLSQLGQPRPHLHSHTDTHTHRHTQLSDGSQGTCARQPVSFQYSSGCRICSIHPQESRVQDYNTAIAPRAAQCKPEKSKSFSPHTIILRLIISAIKCQKTPMAIFSNYSGTQRDSAY